MFWSNHFCISAINGPARRHRRRLRARGDPPASRPFRRHAARREHHPAMLIYLDNAQSIAPTRAGLNSGAASTRISPARSWSCTLSASTAATDEEDVTRSLPAGADRLDDRRSSQRPGRRARQVPLPRARHQPGPRNVLHEFSQLDEDPTGARRARETSPAIRRPRVISPASSAVTSSPMSRRRQPSIGSPPPFRRATGFLTAVYEALLSAPEAWVLADTMRARGDLRSARELEEACVQGMVRTRGLDDRDTLIAMSNLSETLHQEGDLDRAKAVGEEVLATMQRVSVLTRRTR